MDEPTAVSGSRVSLSRANPVVLWIGPMMCQVGLAENLALVFYLPWKHFSSVYSSSQSGGLVPSLFFFLGPKSFCVLVSHRRSLGG